MVSKFHENCVITGVIDSFCLLCETYVSKKDIDQHIRTPTHKFSLKNKEYLEKYREDHIRKVKLGYFCEECNLLLNTLTKVDIHTLDPAHISNKNKQYFKEVDIGVIVFEDILINHQAWHGLNYDTCYICNTDYIDEDAHRSESTHIVKIIHSNFELQRNQFLYRRIDDYFNCLTCNILLSSKSKDTHVKDAEHINNYSKCQEMKKLFDDVSHAKSLENIEKTNKVDKQDTSSDKAKEKLEDNVSLSIILEILNEQADEILKPEEAYKRAKSFAKENNLKYKRHKVYCQICDVKLSGSLKKMKEHVDNKSHQDNSRKPVIRKMPTCEFIYSKASAMHLLFDNIIINDKYCMSALSYNFIIKIGSKYKCLLCQVKINNVNIHICTVNHSQAMLATFVIVNYDSEFIREVRPDIYHCSVCNYLESGWDGLSKHMSSSWHIEKKFAYRRLMAQYTPDLYKKKLRESFVDALRSSLNIPT